MVKILITIKCIAYSLLTTTKPGSTAHSVVHLTEESEVPGSIPGVHLLSFKMIMKSFPLSTDSHPVNYAYQKMLLNENESYLVLVARQILLVRINNVY